jgi:hypothetical protein
MSDSNMLETLYLILNQNRSVLSAQTQSKPSPIYLKGGVGVFNICNNNYSTPPPEITLATLRYLLSTLPRPFPDEVQAIATSIALYIAQGIPDLILPTGVSPINPNASELLLKYRKRIAQSKPSAKFLLDQIGYRVPDVSQAIEALLIDAHKLAKAKREYESL